MMGLYNMPGSTSLDIHCTVYPKKYAHGFCFAVLCCGYTLTDFQISIRLTSLALWQSNDCPSASKATLMNMDKYFMWIHYERLHNHNKAKHNKTVCIFLGIYCRLIIHVRMADRALLAGYPRYMRESTSLDIHCRLIIHVRMADRALLAGYPRYMRESTSLDIHCRLTLHVRFPAIKGTFWFEPFRKKIRKI